MLILVISNPYCINQQNLDVLFYNIQVCFQLALDFVFLFWPVSAYQILKELTSNRRMKTHWEDLSFQHVLDTSFSRKLGSHVTLVLIPSLKAFPQLEFFSGSLEPRQVIGHFTQNSSSQLPQGTEARNNFFAETHILYRE